MRPFLNFCSSNLPCRSSSVRSRPVAWVCTTSPEKNINAGKISRRHALGLLLSFPVYSVLAQNESKETTAEKPLSGFLTKSGLKYYDFQAGEGVTPQWGDLLDVHYVLYTITPSGDGLVMHDTTYRRGSNGYLIHHGNGEMVLGLEEALHTMKTGGRRRAIVPLPIGYSRSGLAPIPPSFKKRRAFVDAVNNGDGTVVFDVELRAIVRNSNDRGYYTDLTPTDEELLKIVQEQKGVEMD